MWIQELFIDEFDGGGDLTLTQLASALNVVRVPSLSAEACLVEFIPTLLYGPDHPRSPLRGGSLVATQSLDHSSYVLDLCRIHLGGTSGLSDLEILTERGQEAVRQHVLQTFGAIDGRTYRAVFTDRLPASERLACWRASDWIAPMLGRTSAPAAPITTPAQSTAPTERSLSRAMQGCLRLVDRLSDSTGGGFAVTPGAGRPEAGDADDHGADPRGRREHLQAKAQEAQLLTRKRELEQRLAGCERRVRLLDQALALRPDWQELRSLDAQLSAPTESPVDPQDRRRLRQIARRRRSIHRQLLEGATRSGEATPREDASSEEALQAACSAARLRCARLQVLADEWPAVEERQRRVNQLRAQLNSPPPTVRVGEAPTDAQWNELRAAVAAIRRAAQERRTARRLDRCQFVAEALSRGRLPHVETPADARDATAGDAPPPTDPRIDSLRRQIRQLREETRAMLERQLLSPRVLVGIGLLFSLGLALLGAAVTLNLDGAEIATGTIGLTCILAAALLKSSFERTPTHLLRKQRLRIADLFAELQQIHDSADAAVDDDAGAEPLGVQSRESSEGDQAERHWRETLARWNLPLDCGPTDAVRRLRERAALSLPRTEGRATDDVPARQDDRRLELDQHQAALDEWTQKAAEALHVPWTVDRSLPQWREELERAYRDGDAERQRLERMLRSKRQWTHRRQRLLREWRSLKEERRRIFARYGAASATELRQRSSAAEDHARLAARRQAWWEAFEAALPPGDDGRQVRSWLETDSDVTSELDEQRRQLHELQQQLQTAHKEWAEVRAALEQQVARPAAAAPSLMSETGEQEATIERQGRVVARTLAAVLSSLPDRPSVETAPTDTPSALSLHDNADPPNQEPRLLQLASEGLRHLLSDPALAVGWVDAAQGPYIARGDGTVTSCDDLSRDDLALLVIALQLSLARCFVERIGQLPLILTDESLGLPEEELARLAELLKDVAADRLQTLVVTVDPLVSDQFRQLDIPSLVITRQEQHARRSAPERSAVRAAIARRVNEE